MKKLSIEQCNEILVLGQQEAKQYNADAGLTVWQSPLTCDLEDLQNAIMIKLQIPIHGSCSPYALSCSKLPTEVLMTALEQRKDAAATDPRLKE